MKLLTKGLAGVLISHDGMIVAAEQSNLFSDQYESILANIYKRKTSIERERRQDNKYT